ncbi:hypothetical protein [Cycloclasticus sp. P1]|uniref:hypothetical protein n=1 Tax=Cycloclasticus sp. (strain P1) TaxID=385025 RepID=UPI000286ADB0|nr:hypothetical protein [Cycloclasticus sp. P1]AFT66426.1 hypothetical protein Q91_0386 [Cycloclasticus sp. P1]
MEILEKTSLSSVDDMGAVFIGDKKVYRGVNRNAVGSTRRLLNCGLIKELEKNRLLPKTRISEMQIIGYELVIEHTKLGPITYPFEWSPEMLRAAALCVLKVNDLANKYGYQLKDCHPYNVVFNGALPTFVDLGSFVKHKEGFGWVAHSEFLGSYYYPLIAKAKSLDSVYKKVFLDSGYGIGLVEGLVLFNPFFRVLGYSNVKKLSEIISSYKAGSKFTAKDIENKFDNKFVVSIAKFLLSSKIMPLRRTNLRSLEKKIKNIKLNGVSKWSRYHETSKYYDEGGNVKLSDRFNWVKSQCQRLKPESITELAGNQGVLIRELSKETFLRGAVIADYDSYAIDFLYLSERESEKITTACFNFMSGTYRHIASDERSNRLRSEMVIAMAVTHHLLLTQGYSIDNILKTILNYTERYMLIEFMPLGLWDGATAPLLPQWYTEEWFVQSLSMFCVIQNRKVLGKNRVIYTCEKI